RLRLRAGAVSPPRPSVDHVGEARSAGARRAACQPSTVELKLPVRLLLLLPAQRVPERRVDRDRIARGKGVSDGGVEEFVRIGLRRQFRGIDQRFGLFHSSSSIYILMISSKLASA